jgi:hypothetical protein
VVWQALIVLVLGVAGVVLIVLWWQDNRRRRGTCEELISVGKDPDIEAIIYLLAVEDLAFAAKVDAGLVDPAEVKAHQARMAEAVALLDEKQGTGDVTYERFRSAFDQGADCEALFVLRNAMHPKDPLKVDANDDLRSVGCHSPGSTRRRKGV